MYSNIVRNSLTYFSVVISGVTVHQLGSENMDTATRIRNS